MPGLRQRIVFGAVLLLGVAPSAGKAMTVEECYQVVQRDYVNCTRAGVYSDLGQCQYRWAERQAQCAQGIFVPIGESSKDQCLNRVEAEYRSCGYRAACTDRWLQGLQSCN